MQATLHRLEFAPPPTRGSVPALVLAVMAHLLLLGALAWGVSWKHQVVTLTAEAELWSALPQSAAPRLVEPTPPPEPPQPEPMAAPKVIEAPVPAPIPAPVPAPPAPVVPPVPDADIALERNKERLAKEKADKAEALRNKQIQQEKAERLAAEKKRADKQREQERAIAADKKKADQKLAEQKLLELKAAQQKQAASAAKTALATQEEARKIEAQRLENIKRMAGLAGASGSATSTGAAVQSSGPSAGYAGRIRARIKPNIVFTEDIAGNPNAEVEVRTSPDGTILSRRLVTSSGVPSWDEAVLKAIDKSQTLPRDVDGRVPPALLISFRPKD